MATEVDEIYTEASAEILCAIAMQGGQCAELLNNLSAGGAVALDVSTTPPRLAFINGDQIAWLASDGVDGHP